LKKYDNGEIVDVEKKKAVLESELSEKKATVAAKYAELIAKETDSNKIAALETERDAILASLDVTYGEQIAALDLQLKNLYRKSHSDLVEEWEEIEKQLAAIDQALAADEVKIKVTT